VRLPPSAETLTSVDFDLVPHKPPPGTKLYDEEIEEIEESESEDEDEDMEPAPIPGPTHSTTQPRADVDMGPVSAIQMPVTARPAGEDGSEGGEDEDGLFAGGDDEEEEEEEESGPEESMEEPKGGDAANGVKRKWVEDDDYD
jgi:transcription initiation factor TFIID subunit 9B